MPVRHSLGEGGGGGIGSVLYTEDASAANCSFFHYNAIGSVVALTDASGAVTSTTDYAAFGKEVKSTGSSDETRKFCTKERSASIGLDNFGFRYYDPELGRFVQRDPSGYPDGPNNYLYCRNNPINFVDPLGLKGKGHHIIPRSIFKKAGFSDEVVRYFENEATTTTVSHGWSKAHKHYNDLIEIKLAEFAEKHGKDFSKWNKKTAEKFVDSIKNSDDKFISGFLKNVKTKAQLNKWWKKSGEKMARTTSESSVFRRALGVARGKRFSKYSRFMKKHFGIIVNVAIIGGTVAILGPKRAITEAFDMPKESIDAMKFNLDPKQIVDNFAGRFSPIDKVEFPNGGHARVGSKIRMGKSEYTVDKLYDMGENYGIRFEGYSMIHPIPKKSTPQTDRSLRY